MRKTKIICTLGPATDDEEVLRQLMLNGMAVARMNMSHGEHSDHKRRADMIKKLRAELNIPVALLLDTKGPEIRTGRFKNNKVNLETGQTFTLTTEDVEGDETRCSITFKDLPKDVQRGSRILIDDGLIEMKVTDVTKTDIVCHVVNGGTVATHKGINIPGVALSLPFISEQDKADIAFGVAQDFDFVAASFTRSAEDIIQLRGELEKNNCNNIRIVAKIENSEGVENIDEIIRVSDGIMIARGDLGVEIPMEEIPIIQKKLIAKAYSAGKQVITATQMLDSMMKNPRPTRAEATDVANAIYDGTSAIMLSGETAAGLFPVEAVKTMAIIAERTERDIDYIEKFRKRDIPERPDVTSAISHATCTTAHDLGAVAILTVSKTGQTARMISKFRPACPIISGTTEPKVLRQMNLSWGVIPILVDEKDNTDELFEHVVSVAQKEGYVHNGDLAVITAGIPLGVSGTTNMLKVHLVGDVLVSGMAVNHNSVYGRLCVCRSEEDAWENFKDGDILVIPKTTNEILPLMRKASGIITETGGINSHAAVVCLALDKPVIVGAKNATKLLKSGTTVKLDGNRGIVFSAHSKK
ncbi:MAG TPA: pyruvate kinase [Candidatus Scatovicinus merdipullorum]|nr:pyruvate kinase [Candidatus Scatovicinus merdipullorum]